MRLAGRMDRIGTETAFEAAARARALEATGRSVIHLEIGEPDFDTPANIREAAKAALDRGATHYTPTVGIPELRAAIASDATARKGFAVTPDRVVVVPGGKPVMFFAILALVDEGDEVIYPDPGFPIYESMASYVGGKAVPCPIRQENGFRLDPDELASLVTPRTRLVIINSPANPTGGVSTREDLEQDRRGCPRARLHHPGRRDLRPHPVRRRARLDRLAAGHGRTHDRPRRLLEDVRHDRLAAGLRDRAGQARHAVQPADREQRQLHQRGHSVGRCRGPHRAAGLRDWRWSRSSGPVAISSWTASTTSRASPACRPSGAFYVFPDISATGLTGADLADRLLNEGGVSALAGTAFGQVGKYHLRFSYANSREKIAEAVRRTRTVVEPLAAAAAGAGARR